MARITRTFSTKSSAQEMQDFINNNVLKRTELQSLIPAARWKQQTLFIDGKFVVGTITLNDHQVAVDVDISFLAANATKRIEAAIEDGIKQLEAGKPE
jgi:hypothetical protein